ncbi:putative Mg2+ transporter-C (MgtC) family protein [Mucilaginibacter yixingensis]|uniref:Putative Mg2+ transporter-C (MgtC) family protein n=1 Tax=Mucilaginibacter yixingensis TaxID=1295612 RepID=A0A2T5J546_9SPHI|nr:MgtC/SapB family protein [Mucilaginibacter yixingensis]PTQ92956.1 putative Mg2+ transporter-C (MgtC) family protein [Mucilaginibacter yixingensis]
MLHNMIQGFDMPTMLQELLMVCVAILIGAVIGTEREYSNKSAGLRTFILVSFGSCVFTILSIKIGVSNPDRLAANIITGIGFLGAGVIFKDNNKIEGITTATTIWATASVGMSAGSGHIYMALAGTLVILVILKLLLPLQAYIDNHHKIREYHIATATPADADECIALFKQYQLKYFLLGEDSSPVSFSRTWLITGNIKNHEQLIANLIHHPKVISYRF